MISSARKHLTYANVMASVAVFLALSGGIAWALARDSVKSKQIVDGQVKGADVLDDGLKGEDVDEESLDGGSIAGLTREGEVH